MKKQILILIFFMAAFVAGTSSAFAQVLLDPGVTDPTGTNQPIDPLSCVGTSIPLHPFPGSSYTYIMDGTTGEEQADTWTWFATKDPDFVTGGVLNTAGMIPAADLLGASANYGVPTAGANSVDITWPADILAGTEYQGTPGSTPSPTFVVGYATGVNCADNIQVYEINPKFNFTIDIASIDESNTTLDWDAVAEECVDIVRGASYNDATKELDMDYGTDTIYFEVAAANFVNDFTPTFRLENGLTGDQTADISLYTSLANAQSGTSPAASTSWASTDIGTATADWATGVAFDATDQADVVTGVSLFVRVIIDNNTHESLTSQDFVLAVDAIDDGAAGQWDMEEDDCDTATATDAVDQADVATSTITPRPTIIMDATNMSEGNGVAPDDVVTKTVVTP